MRPAAHSHVHREQPRLSMAGHDPEGHADAKASRDAANRSIALTGLLLDSVAMKKGRTPRGSTAALIATCRCNSRPSRAKQHGLQ